MYYVKLMNNRDALNNERVKDFYFQNKTRNSYIKYLEAKKICKQIKLRKLLKKYKL